MDGLVERALQATNWDAAAAREWALKQGGAEMTPPLAVFEAGRAEAAEAEWQRAVRRVGFENLPAKETEAMLDMGTLRAHLSDESYGRVIQQERARHGAANPHPFMGLKKKGE